jgi:hypothetical protein
MRTACIPTAIQPTAERERESVCVREREGRREVEKKGQTDREGKEVGEWVSPDAHIP